MSAVPRSWLGACVMLSMLGAGAAKARATPAAAVAACVAEGAPIRNPRVDGGAIELCAGDDADRRCVRVALATGAWEARPTMPDPAPVPMSEARPTGLHVCTPDGARCTDVTPPGYHAPDGQGVAGNDDLSIVALWNGVDPMKLSALPGLAPLATIAPWPTAMSGGRDPSFFQGVHFLGAGVVEVLISESPVNSSARLYDVRTGKQLGAVGKPHTQLDEVAPFSLGGDRYAFVTFMERSLIIENVRSSKIERAIPLAPRELTGAALVAYAPGGKQLVVVPYDASVPIFVVDPKKGVKQKLPIPVCHAASAPR